MIVIVDYGAGNLRSVQNMLRNLGFESKIANQRDEIECATRIILPGVGAFDYGMQNLADHDLIDVLNYKVLEQHTPTLGICLGAQLLSRGSEEGSLPGLGWVEAATIRFDTKRLKPRLRVPHMGWADTDVDKSHPLFEGVTEMPRYYYVHSYHLVCDRVRDELCHAQHGYRFVSGIARGNVIGLQFHPEKSHQFGKTVLANFATKEYS